MKKRYFAYAGIVSGVLLAGIFTAILLTGIPFPFQPPVITLDPLTDASVDDNGILILTGATTLPAAETSLNLWVTASNRSATPETAAGKTKQSGDAWIIPKEQGNNRWKGTIDITPLQPGEYTINLTTVVYSENLTKRTESDPLVTRRFTLGDGQSGPGSIRKRTRVITPFIRVNSPDQDTAGNSPEISGITSLAPGSPLAWSLQAAGNATSSSTKVFPGNCTVITGIDGINRWYAVPGTGAMEPGRYRFNITGQSPGNGPGTISATSEFDIPLPRQNRTGPRAGGFLSIDTLPEMRTDGVYVITGTTSLPPGEQLLVQIYPASGFDLLLDREKGQTGDFSGASGMTAVEIGTGGRNLWAFEVQTYHFTADRYVVIVNNDKFDYDTFSIIPGDLSGSRKFYIGG
jgi:hypothetical protein